MPAKLLLAFVLGIAAAAALAACGAKENKALIPASAAGRIERKLDALRADVAAGECARVSGRLQDLRNELARLPSSVSVRLRQNVSDGASRLEETAGARCAANRAKTTSVDTAPAVTQETPAVTTPKPTTTATTPTDTTSVPTQTATTPIPTVPTPPTTPSTPSGGAVAPTTTP